MTQNEKEQDFQVKDRRLFNADGSVRENAEVDKGPQATPSHTEKETSSKQTPPQDIDFSTFILSLASSVQINLGLIPHPVSQKPQVNVVAAKQTIDILGMLEEKTKGNLDSQEEHILKQILFELRMQYVEMKNKP